MLGRLAGHFLLPLPCRRNVIGRTENGRKDEGDQEWSFYFGGGRRGATGGLSHGRPLQAKCERASRQPSKVTSPQASVRVFYCIVVNTWTTYNISIVPSQVSKVILMSPFLYLSFVLVVFVFPLRSKLLRRVEPNCNTRSFHSIAFGRLMYRY